MATINKNQIESWLSAVTDPEVPVLNIFDLGIVRDIQLQHNTSQELEKVVIVITPTYSGCPAMDVISTQIRMILLSHKIPEVEIQQQLSPAWTTDWMPEAAHDKLKKYGIAPPQYRNKNDQLFAEEKIECPKCGSLETELVSQFGATSCKALYKCLTCKEPFEHFKCH